MTGSVGSLDVVPHGHHVAKSAVDADDAAAGEYHPIVPVVRLAGVTGLQNSVILFCVVRWADAMVL